MPVDYSKYPKDWKLRSKFIRFFRAQNQCEICGAKNYENKVVLTVMHLNHNTNNNSLLNLVAGCQKCHNNYDRDFRNQNRTGKKQTIKTISLNDIMSNRLPNYFHLFRRKLNTSSQKTLF